MALFSVRFVEVLKLSSTLQKMIKRHQREKMQERTTFLMPISMAWACCQRGRRRPRAEPSVEELKSWSSPPYRVLLYSFSVFAGFLHSFSSLFEGAEDCNLSYQKNSLRCFRLVLTRSYHAVYPTVLISVFLTPKGHMNVLPTEGGMKCSLTLQIKTDLGLLQHFFHDCHCYFAVYLPFEHALGDGEFLWLFECLWC